MLVNISCVLSRDPLNINGPNVSSESQGGLSSQNQNLIMLILIFGKVLLQNLKNATDVQVIIYH